MFKFIKMFCSVVYPPDYGSSRIQFQALWFQCHNSIITQEMRRLKWCLVLPNEGEVEYCRIIGDSVWACFIGAWLMTQICSDLVSVGRITVFILQIGRQSSTIKWHKMKMKLSKSISRPSNLESYQLKVYLRHHRLPGTVFVLLNKNNIYGFLVTNLTTLSMLNLSHHLPSNFVGAGNVLFQLRYSQIWTASMIDKASFDPHSHEPKFRLSLSVELGANQASDLV